MKGVTFLIFLPVASASFQKDTYAMSHPFAFQAFMEQYFPTAEKFVQENETSDCAEWVKLCIDDGHMTNCHSPIGNFQIHSVGAYARDSGNKSMEQIETEFTQSMGSMKIYDPYFEYHLAMLTEDLNSYVSAFDAGSVPYFASSWTDPGTQKAYKSVLIQVPGSLAAGAKSILNIELLADSSSLLEARADLHQHAIPRASSAALAAAHAHLAAAPRKLSASGKPVVAKVHRSWASSDVSRDASYFESSLQGSKSYETTMAEGKVYAGKMLSNDTAELRYVQSSEKTQGPTSVADWEAYQVNLHNTCFDSVNNEGFDRLADNHIGVPLAGVPLDAYIKGQKAAGLPYRFYIAAGLQSQGPGPGGFNFFYMYAANGWGCQIIGSCTDTSLCPSSSPGGYDMCTQGIKGHCRKDGVVTNMVV